MRIRNLLALTSSAVAGLLLSSCNACTEQHDPRPALEQFKKEEEAANKPKALLNPDGTYPEPQVETKDEDAQVADANPIKGKYDQFCGSCHGANGAGDGAAAASLNPKPRNFADAAWQKATKDEAIYKIIKEGGAAVGMSATMAPWGAVLSDDEINEMVKLVRSFSK
jgi:mono/diheme cytochrome c family protein